MLNAEQRDYIVELCNKESNPNVRHMLQSFCDMHSKINPPKFLTDISVDLLDMGLECHRAGHNDAAAAITFMAGAVVRPGVLEKVNSVTMMLSIASMTEELQAAIGQIQAKKKRGGKKGPDASPET